ncbi:cadherin-like domain-containing protein, partial [Psychromonas marina]|uniref:cadherin-like domain-containing protein n=1 Tax=Psychromonas marina TaxID=88364 RepID=UPI0024E145C3
MSESENNELNDAVEQVSTDDSATSGAESNSGQNRESTITSTVATGVDSVAADLAESNLADGGGGVESSGADVGSDEGENSDDGGAAAAAAASSADSQAVEGAAESTEEGAQSSASASAEAPAESEASSGAQSVGGTDTSGPTATAGAQVSSADVASAATEETVVSEGAEATEDDSDSITNSQTFEVNVESDINEDGTIDADDLPTSDTATDSLTFEVDVTPENDAPTAVDKLFSMQEDGIITFTAEELLVGATDIDGDDLSIESVNYSGTDGVLTANQDGSFSFAPNENFNGNVDVTFTVSDGTTTVDANIDLSIQGVNDFPVAGSTSYQMNEDGSINLSPNQLLANASDVEGEVALDSVTYSGTDGVLVNNEDGSVTFLPNENFNGDISLDVAVVDEAGAITVGNAGIEVLAVNDLPIAGETSYTIDEDSVLIFNESQILANASD